MRACTSLVIAGALFLLATVGPLPAASSPAGLAAGDAGSRAENGLRRRDYYEDEESALGEGLSCVWLVGPLDCWRARSAADRASTWAVEYNKSGELAGLHNGRADAFRHCAWNALMVHAIGAGQAKEVADNHENSSSNPPAERDMDLANNSRGRQVGMSTGSDAAAKFQCYDMAKRGILKHIS